MGRYCIIYCILFLIGPVITTFSVESFSEINANQTAAQIISQNFGSYFTSSLQTRENCEAILMPAIILQQVFDLNSTELRSSTMECDSVIEICNPGDTSPFSLSAHYFVGRESYQIAILSANPELKKINLTVPATGLLFQSNSNSFSVSHLYYTNLNRSFFRPFGEPPTFKFMYGDYQLAQLRYLDQDALCCRKLINEIRDAYRPQVDTTNSKVSEQMLTNNDNRYSTVAKFVHGKLEMLQMFSEGNTLDACVEYEYSGLSEKSLSQETIIYPEKTIIAGFQGSKSIRVNINDRVYDVKTFPLTFRRGGRVVAIKYGASNCYGFNLSIPNSIEVLFHTNGVRKVNIQLNNFKYKASEPGTDNGRNINIPISRFSKPS